MIVVGYLKYRAKGNKVADFFMSNAPGCEAHYNTVARITFDGMRFDVENLRELPWLSSPENDAADARSR